MRGNKKLNPEFSWINEGGSMSAISICSIDLDMSSTENGMLQQKNEDMSRDRYCYYTRQQKRSYNRLCCLKKMMLSRDSNGFVNTNGFENHAAEWFYIHTWYQYRKMLIQHIVSYLESSSSRKELLTALLESSVIRTLILDTTCTVILTQKAQDL